MISADYLCKPAAPPSDGARFLHQQAIPAAIDGLAAGEAIVEAVTQRIRERPLVGVCIAFGVGLLLSTMAARRGN